MRMQWAAPMPPPPCAGPSEAPPELEERLHTLAILGSKSIFSIFFQIFGETYDLRAIDQYYGFK